MILLLQHRRNRRRVRQGLRGVWSWRGRSPITILIHFFGPRQRISFGYVREVVLPLGGYEDVAAGHFQTAANASKS